MFKPPTILSDGFQSGWQARIWIDVARIWINMANISINGARIWINVARIWINVALELKGRALTNLGLSSQGSVIHGAVGRALLAGGAALQPDERTAQPLRGQNVLQTQRPSASSPAHAPAGGDQTPVCDQVGKRLFALEHQCFSSVLAAARQERRSQRRCVEVEGKVAAPRML